LLAVETNPEEIQGNGASVASTFRAEPAGVFEIDINLRVANLDFADYVKMARNDPDGIYLSKL
jgi:hypothetical protein